MPYLSRSKDMGKIVSKPASLDSGVLGKDSMIHFGMGFSRLTVHNRWG